VLVHPVWWSPDGRAADRALLAHAAARVAAAEDERRRVARHYAGLAHLGNRGLFEDLGRE
jgi:hypothetical protein